MPDGMRIRKKEKEKESTEGREERSKFNKIWIYDKKNSNIFICFLQKRKVQKRKKRNERNWKVNQNMPRRMPMSKTNYYTTD